MLILLGLALLWAAVLVPPLIRNRDVLLRPVVAFAGVGRSLGRSGPQHLRAAHMTATSIPADPQSARRRRRDLMATLVGLATFTFFGGVAVGGVVWMIHFMIAVLLVGYAVLVTQRHQSEAERKEIVVPFRANGPLMGGIGASAAMRDEAVLNRKAN